MTKKDYIKLAQALKDSRPPAYLQLAEEYKDSFTQIKNQWLNTVEHITATLQLDNPQFNRDRFLHACGYTQEG